ncbi:MAG: desulfoferrodoxin Dfx [Clostridia bacterium]|nr:desulfoferrodoxin Dfx [Clostridia bacterium]
MLIRCNRCGKILNVIKNSACDTICCGEPMVEVKANSVDAAVEKHVPNYEVHGDKILVKVNHVMEEEHYIEWIAMDSGNRFEKVVLKPGDAPEAEFTYVPGATLYSYCNKHSLWKSDVL